MMINRIGHQFIYRMNHNQSKVWSWIKFLTNLRKTESQLKLSFECAVYTDTISCIVIEKHWTFTWERNCTFASMISDSLKKKKKLFHSRKEFAHFVSWLKKFWKNKVDVYSFVITLIFIVCEDYSKFNMKKELNGVLHEIQQKIVGWVRELIVKCFVTFTWRTPIVWWNTRNQKVK